MKKILLSILLLSSITIFASFPKPAGYVNDTAGILSSKTISSIETIAGELDKKSRAQFTVLTVKSLDGMTIEEYGWRLFEKWGIGKKGEDTGVLLLVAPTERKVRIEVGYGFEGAIPDSTAGRIIRTEILPYFKNDDMNTGILRGSFAVMTKMAEEKGVSLTGTQNIPQDVNGTVKNIFNTIMTLLMFFLFGGGGFGFVLVSLLGQSRGFYSRSGRGFFSGGSGGFGGFSGNGGSGFGGFSGGGFGGFGGGSSGGGGASGSW